MCFVTIPNFTNPKIMSELSYFSHKPLFLSIFKLILTPSQADTAPSHLNSVLDIFSHCTLVVTFTTNQTDFLPLHPMLILVKNFQAKPEYEKTNTFLFTNVSFTRRRQPAKFCWAYVFPIWGSNFHFPAYSIPPYFHVQHVLLTPYKSFGFHHRTMRGMKST